MYHPYLVNRESQASIDSRLDRQSLIDAPPHHQQRQIDYFKKAPDLHIERSLNLPSQHFTEQRSSQEAVQRHSITTKDLCPPHFPGLTNEQYYTRFSTMRSDQLTDGTTSEVSLTPDRLYSQGLFLEVDMFQPSTDASFTRKIPSALSSSRHRRLRQGAQHDPDRSLSIRGKRLTTAPEGPGKRRAVPPRVPEVPRLPTPDLSPMYGEGDAFCTCCTSATEAPIKSYSELRQEEKMNAQCQYIFPL